MWELFPADGGVNHLTVANPKGKEGTRGREAMSHEGEKSVSLQDR